MSYLKPFHQKPSDPIFSDRFSDDWIARYEESHKDPVNRVFHTFGIPMIALSILLLLIAPFKRGFWKIAVGLFLTGWVFQFVGHAFEGKPPEFFKDWRFLFVGLRWWLKSGLSDLRSFIEHNVRAERLSIYRIKRL
jgi:uncharacterized membrane protein YGL010W